MTLDKGRIITTQDKDLIIMDVDPRIIMEIIEEVDPITGEEITQTISISRGITIIDPHLPITLDSDLHLPLHPKTSPHIPITSLPLLLGTGGHEYSLSFW
jgi:hypothetical protein